MFCDPLVIENTRITPEQEKASELINKLIGLERPIYNLMEQSKVSEEIPSIYNGTFSDSEISDICKFFLPLPAIHENVSRAVMFSNASSVKYDENKTRIFSSNIRVFAYGIGYWFHILAYPDYGRSFVTVGYSGINSPENLLGPIEKTDKSEMFIYFCDLLMSHCSQNEPSSI